MLPQPISYKDNKAFVYKKDNKYYRCLFNSYKEEYECLMNSGLYKELLEKDLIISHSELSFDETINSSEGIFKIIYPEQIAFVSYPYEWTFSQWKDTCITLLSINLIALKYGMILKDATPYNFVFKNNRCILLDTSSFTFYNEGKPWLAYKQFCEEMLSPLLLMKYKGFEWSRLYRTAITGFSLNFVSTQLPLKSGFNFLSFWHIHLHSFFSKKSSNSQKLSAKNSKEQVVSLQKLLLLKINSLHNNKKHKSNWNNYYQTGIESNKYSTHKKEIVEQWLKAIRPDSLVDLGANTGNFSFIASKFANKVYAVDEDVYCVEELFKISKYNKIQNLTCAVIDIVNPSPGIGWMNEEKLPLLKRLMVETILALAILHHLCISKNLPLNFVAELFYKISTKYLIIEFVPKQDKKVQFLLENREDIFVNYTEENFKKEFSNYFEIVEEIQIDYSLRKLFLCKKKFAA